MTSVRRLFCGNAELPLEVRVRADGCGSAFRRRDAASTAARAVMRALANGRLRERALSSECLVGKYYGLTPISSIRAKATTSNSDGQARSSADCVRSDVTCVGRNGPRRLRSARPAVVCRWLCPTEPACLPSTACAGPCT